MSKEIRNLYQRYTNMFGINSSIARSIISHLGYHHSYPTSDLKNTFVFTQFNKFMKEKEQFFEASYKKNVGEHLLKKLSSRDYHGNRMRSELPVRGQRRRANARSVKVVLRKIKQLRNS